MPKEEKHLEHEQNKHGDQVQVGKPITSAEDNAKHEREQALTMAKAFRFTKDSSNAFTIDMGDGKSVQDKRPMNPSGASEQPAVSAKNDGYDYSGTGRDTLPGFPAKPASESPLPYLPGKDPLPQDMPHLPGKSPLPTDHVPGHAKYYDEAPPPVAEIPPFITKWQTVDTTQGPGLSGEAFDGLLDKFKHLDNSKSAVSDHSATMKNGITVSVEHGHTVIKDHGKPIDVEQYAQERHIGGKSIYELPGGIQMVKEGNITTVTDKKNGTEVISDQNGILARVQADNKTGTAVVDLPGGQSVKLPGGEIVSADGAVAGQCPVSQRNPFGETVIELPNGMMVKCGKDYGGDGDGLSLGDRISGITFANREGQVITADQLFEKRESHRPQVFQTFAAENLEGPKPNTEGQVVRPELRDYSNLIESASGRPNETSRTSDTNRETEVNKSHLSNDRANTAVAFAEHEKNNPRWDSDHIHHTYKCNAFVDACLRAASINLPWDKDHVPTVQDIVKHPPHDWQKVSENAQMKPGDLIMWVGGNYNHCSIYDGKGSVIYAGSAVERGWAKSRLDLMENSPMGKPQAIFRPSYGDK